MKTRMFGEYRNDEWLVATEEDDSTVALALFVLGEGCVGEAIKVYQEDRKLTRSQAKQQVRELAHQHGLSAAGFRFWL